MILNFRCVSVSQNRKLHCSWADFEQIYNRREGKTSLTNCVNTSYVCGWLGGSEGDKVVLKRVLYFVSRTLWETLLITEKTYEALAKWRVLFLEIMKKHFCKKQLNQIVKNTIIEIHKTTFRQSKWFCFRHFQYLTRAANICFSVTNSNQIQSPHPVTYCQIQIDSGVCQLRPCVPKQKTHRQEIKLYSDLPSENSFQPFRWLSRKKTTTQSIRVPSLRVPSNYCTGNNKKKVLGLYQPFMIFYYFKWKLLTQFPRKT